MANVPFITQTFGTPSGILMFPDEYQARANTFLPTDANAVSVNGKKIIKAGTIWPSNDANAKGVVLYDVDVTNGTGEGALLFEASVKTSKLPSTPEAAAIAALPRITFFGVGATVVATATITGLTAPVKSATPKTLEDLAVTGSTLALQSLAWSPDDDAFEAETVYTAIITAVPAAGKIISQELAVTIAGATTVTEDVSYDGSFVTITAVFPATAA